MTNLHIPYDIFLKMLTYAEIADETLNAEIGGMLIVDELETGGLFIRDALLPEQEVSAGTFTVKPGEWMKDLKIDDLQNIRGMWHSHRNMGTFHSNVDDDTLGDKWDGENKNSNTYGISVVVALPREIKAYLQYYRPIKTKPFTVDINIIHPEQETLYKTCKKLVEERAKKKLPYQCERNFQNTQRSSGGQAGVGKTGEKVTIKRLKKGISQEVLEETITDPLFHMSIADLKECGMWSPAKFPDLVEELEEAMYEEIEEKDIERGSKLPQITDPKECNHLSLNEKNRKVCFFQGRKYDCSKCLHHPISHRTETDERENEEEDSPVTSIVPVKNKTENN